MLFGEKQMEPKKVSLKDVEALVGTMGYTSKKDDYQGIYVKDSNHKTVAYISERKYGLAYQSSVMENGVAVWKTERINDLTELSKKFGAPFGNPITKDEYKPTETPKPEIKVSDIMKSDIEKYKELIPSDFIYIERKIATGKTDLKEFEDAMMKQKNVLLEGPTGSGKTTMIRKFCAKHSLPYKRISLNGGCTVEDLVGHYVLRNMETAWIDGILTQAVRHGWVLAIDEINAAPSEVLFVLNSLLDDERVLILSSKDGEVVKPHPNFRAIATCNPTEQGYAGTNEINEALRDRFHFTFYIDYDEKVEEKLMKSMGLDEQKRKDIADFVSKIRESYAENETITPFSTRSVMNFAEMVKDGKEQLILNRFRSNERAIVSDLLDVFIYKKKSPAETSGSKY